MNVYCIIHGLIHLLVICDEYRHIYIIIGHAYAFKEQAIKELVHPEIFKKN